MPSSRRSWNDPNLKARANDHDSPWEAYPLAGISPICKTMSSRCGPTRVTPRMSSSARRVAKAARNRCASSLRSIGSGFFPSCGGDHSPSRSIVDLYDAVAKSFTGAISR